MDTGKSLNKGSILSTVIETGRDSSNKNTVAKTGKSCITGTLYINMTRITMILLKEKEETWVSNKEPWSMGNSVKKWQEKDVQKKQRKCCDSTKGVNRKFLMLYFPKVANIYTLSAKAVAQKSMYTRQLWQLSDSWVSTALLPVFHQGLTSLETSRALLTIAAWLRLLPSPAWLRLCLRGFDQANSSLRS